MPSGIVCPPSGTLPMETSADLLDETTDSPGPVSVPCNDRGRRGRGPPAPCRPIYPIELGPLCIGHKVNREHFEAAVLEDVNRAVTNVSPDRAAGDNAVL